MPVIDLSQTPAPDVVETLDYETILADLKSDLLDRVPESDRAAVDATLAYESEPLTILLETVAYRETVLRQRINEAARADMLPYAMGADLDNLATFYGVQRLVVRAADPDANPPEPAVYESDAELRRRVQLAPDGFSVAGPEGAYVYFALSADGGVLDASADAPSFSAAETLDDGRIAFTVDHDAGLDQPRPGDVVISVLARDGDGTPDADLVAAVHDALYADNVRPMTDHPIVRAAEIVNYQIQATIYTLPGPDSSVVLDDALTAIEHYTTAQHRLGLDVTLSGVYAALHQPGVQRVELASPAADLIIGPQQAAYCTDITIKYGGVDE